MMIVKAVKQDKITKVELAKRQGVSISSLYYHPKKPRKDWQLKNQIERVLSKNPSYGHKRIALELKISKKKLDVL